MGVAVSNQWVAERRERVFANTAAFNVETPMAGRRDALEVLRAIVTSKGGARCAVISDLLGAGKTFFLQHAFARFRGSKDKPVDEQTEKADLTIDDVVRSSALNGLEARVVVVEELDRKAGRSHLEAAVDKVSSWLRDDRLAILTGDFSVRDPQLLAALDEKGEIRRIQLEPLDGNLLCEAIELRLHHWLCDEGIGKKEAMRWARKATVNMFDAEFSRALWLPTNPPVVTFREVMGLLQGMAEYLPLDTQPCRFTPDTYRQWMARSPRLRRWNEPQDQFLHALYDQIRRVGHGRVLEPIDVDRSPWVAELAEGRAEEYQAEVLEPLVRAGVLLPMGIPYAAPTRKRLPGPYLPTVRTYLDALLGEGEV